MAADNKSRPSHATEECLDLSIQVGEACLNLINLAGRVIHGPPFAINALLKLVDGFSNALVRKRGTSVKRLNLLH